MLRISASTLRTLAMEASLITAIAGAGAYAWAGRQTEPAGAPATNSSHHSSPIAPEYHIYRGNTHSHTSFTWSHGAQWAKNDCKGVPRYAPDANDPEVESWAPEGNQPTAGKCPYMIMIGSSQYPGPFNILRPD
jgi:hypothetical protein